MRSSGVMRFAHRGAHIGSSDENSIASFRRACLSREFDGFECDVRLTRDGVLVALHDDTLERTHGDPRHVHDIMSDEIEGLNIPRISEVVMLALEHNICVVYDMKVCPGACCREIDNIYADDRVPRIFLIWKPRPVDTNAIQLYACETTFIHPPEGIDGIAAKFDGSPENLQSIAALPLHLHLNLYTDRVENLPLIEKIARSRPNTSLTF